MHEQNVLILPKFIFESQQWN